jgi:hypothetical protein
MTYDLVNSFHWAIGCWIFNRSVFWFDGPILQERYKIFFKLRPIVKDNFAWARILGEPCLIKQLTNWSR